MKGTYKPIKPAPAFKFKVPGGVKAVAAYDELVRAWRAGVVSDFYYGTRSDTDPSLVWQVDGVEVAGGSDTARVLEILEERRRSAGVEAIAWGDWWCGFHAIVVVFASGLVVEQCYRDGAVCEIVTEPAQAVA